MQTGSSETLIGLNAGQTTLYGAEWRERGYGVRQSD